jgi:hypothetical protein
MKLGLTQGPTSIVDLLRVMDHRLSPLDNFQCKVLGPIVTPGAANVEFTVGHNLGRTPINYIWNVDQNCVVYDSRRVNWTAQQMFLKCSVVSATLYLIVF